MHRILIVEDNPIDQRLFEQALSDPTREIEICSDGREALAAFERRAADVVISDIMMPNMEGNELLTELHRRVPGLPIILVTRFGSISAAVAAMQAGAFDYVTKPVEVFELQTRVKRALELDQLHHENDTLRQELAGRFGPDSVVAESIESRKLMELVRRIAASHSTVLIQGESGTGKELVARLVHYWSDRVGHPFVAVNCKAFAESVLESELFGHEKGAFTGAIAARQGCFERASGGTLLLDEIGDISPEFQAKLLRVLQEGEVLRVGGSEPRRINVRVVAATNSSLQDKVAAGRFREDLYFRLNVIPIQLLPLRERREDILALARNFSGPDGSRGRPPYDARPGGRGDAASALVAGQRARARKRDRTGRGAHPRRRHHRGRPDARSGRRQSLPAAIGTRHVRRQRRALGGTSNERSGSAVSPRGGPGGERRRRP